MNYSKLGDLWQGRSKSTREWWFETRSSALQWTPMPIFLALLGMSPQNWAAGRADWEEVLNKLTPNTGSYWHKLLDSTDTKYWILLTQNTRFYSCKIQDSTDTKYWILLTQNTGFSSCKIQGSTDTKYWILLMQNTGFYWHKILDSPHAKYRILLT